LLRRQSATFQQQRRPLKLEAVVERGPLVDRARLGHELTDCLWPVLVLTDRYGIDLPAELTTRTAGIDEHLDQKTS
jgi:NTP pyrophosphatase (non-canonical NTP hydrolase)